MSEPGNTDALPDHHVRLTDDDLVLRPMREDDLPQALEWNNEPEVHLESGHDLIDLQIQALDRWSTPSRYGYRTGLLCH